MKNQEQDYAKVFQNGENEGFSVKSAREYVTEDGNHHVDHWMKTPYFYKDMPVIGYAVADVSFKKPLRDYNTVEFWIASDGIQRNLEDVDANYQLYDKNGNEVDREKARVAMGEFASAASMYPHVVTYEEYEALREPVNKRLNLGYPTYGDYGHYLDNVERQMHSGIRFVGAITNCKQLRETYPVSERERWKEMDNKLVWHDDFDVQFD